MDGVKPLSVGYDSVLRIPACVERTSRIRIKPQPMVSVYNGSKLGRRGMRPAMVHIHWQGVDTFGDSYIRFSLADRILDRESLLSATSRKFGICRGRFDLDHLHYSDQHTSQKHIRLFYQKRGV